MERLPFSALSFFFFNRLVPIGGLEEAQDALGRLRTASGRLRMSWGGSGWPRESHGGLRRPEDALGGRLMDKGRLSA